MNQFRGSALTGGTGVGKTETVKGLAFFLGRYLALFGCSPHSDPAALGKVVQGLAMVRSAKNKWMILLVIYIKAPLHYL